MIGLLLNCVTTKAQNAPAGLHWPAISSDTRPWTRWWWLGNAVDTPGLAYNLQAFQQAGLGGVEITPIYGVKGFEKQFIPFLSPAWMHMLRYTISEATRLGMSVDMNTGTGWPFGGPGITPEHAAARVYFRQYTLAAGEQLKEQVQPPEKATQAVLQALMAYGSDGRRIDLTAKVAAGGILRWTAPAGSWQLIALFNGKTGQKVKRASPGGEGPVMDHFSKEAVSGYLQGFTSAFAGTPVPHTFFNDSYEVYGADWSPGLLQEFARRRGYRLQDHLPAFLGQGNSDTVRRVINDYRETLSDMLLENFTRTWVSWAHRMGSTTRNQAHGSPANLLDLYAAVDVPECESFGTTHFNIPGLRIDSGEIRHTESNPLMLRFAASAAHITGKKLVSAESFTWLTEHFKTALSQCKPELDNLLLAGVNHVVFHGTPYSPKGAPWPGWLFYASVEFSPYNTFWPQMPAFTDYITRCQAFLQDGKADSDILLYWPVYDVWQSTLKSPALQFAIHNTDDWMKPFPFFNVATTLVEKGFGVDFISDRLLQSVRADNGKVYTPGSTYRAIVIPPCRYILPSTLQQLLQLARAGATVIFLEHWPEDVPGLHRLQDRRQQLEQLRKTLPAVSFGVAQQAPLGKGRIITGQDIAQALPLAQLSAETLVDSGLRYIRRRHATGYYYFIANQEAKDFDGWLPLATPLKTAAIFDAYTGKSGMARVREGSGQAAVYAQLKAGASLIISTDTTGRLQGPEWAYWQPAADASAQPLNGKWTLAFKGGEPAIDRSFELDSLHSWTFLPDSAAKVYAGTALYTISFNRPEAQADDWLLDLGTVRESAVVKLNGKTLDTLWALPFQARIGSLLQPGKNTLEIAVTNLPANRIADYDRKGKEWRIFYEINFVNVFYKPFTAAGWQPVSSGLLGPVRLLPLRKLVP